MKKYMKRTLTLMLVLAMAMTLCTNSFAAESNTDNGETPVEQRENTARTSEPILGSIKDFDGNTWGTICSASAGGKSAMVSTACELDKVHDSSPDTFDAVAKRAKITLKQTAWVITLEGGSDDYYCSGEKTVTGGSGELYKYYTYMSMVTGLSSTHSITVAYDGKSSSYNTNTVA